MEAQAGGVHEVDHGQHLVAVFVVFSGAVQIGLQGGNDFIEFCRAGGLRQAFGVGQGLDLEGQGLGFALGDGPIDHDFEIAKALVGVGRGCAVLALEIFDKGVGDVADGIFAEVGFDLFEGPADGFVITGAFIEFDVGQIVGDDIVNAGVGDGGPLAVLLGEFGPAFHGVFVVAGVVFAAAL